MPLETHSRKTTMADNARKRPHADLTEEASPRRRRCGSSDAAGVRCPITQELPLDPVIAKDGKIYEGSLRSGLEERW